MNYANPNQTAATLKELQAACPEASSDFLVDQLAKDASVDQAMRAHNAALSQELGRLKKLVPKTSTGSQAGNDALSDVEGSSAAGSGNATEEWNEQVASFVKSGKSRRLAVGLVNKSHPGLREQMLAEAHA